MLKPREVQVYKSLLVQYFLLYAGADRSYVSAPMQTATDCSWTQLGITIDLIPSESSLSSNDYSNRGDLSPVSPTNRRILHSATISVLLSRWLLISVVTTTNDPFVVSALN